MNLIQCILDIVCNTFLEPSLLEKARRRPVAFTRNNGKLPYWTMIKLLLSNVKKTISSSLDEFFRGLCIRAGMHPSQATICSQQAFSKARAGIDHSLFKECFERILDFRCAPDAIDWHRRLGGEWGIQVISIDGSRIPLPNFKYLLDAYGGAGREADSPTAIASIAYDGLNEMVLDAQFEPLCIDERTLAMRHLRNIKAKNRVNLSYSLFIFDRGYASRELITFIQKDINTSYLFRLRDKFSPVIDAMDKPKNMDDIVDQTLELYEGIKVRVLRFYLPSGQMETLLTNKYGLDAELFRKLYFLRWPVEEEYKLIKQKIGLTCFRGRSENSILQEFWISMLLTNIANAIKKETDGIIKFEHEAISELKHQYKTNMNELAGALSRFLPDYMDADRTNEKTGIIRHLFAFLISRPVIDKKGSGESNPRKEARKVKNHHNVKYTH